MKTKFSRDIFEKYINNFMKICLVRVEIFHAKGWTDRDRQVETNKRFSQFYGCF